MFIAVAVILFVLAVVKLVLALTSDNPGLAWGGLLLAAVNILGGVLNIVAPATGIHLAVGIYVCLLAFVSLVLAIVCFIGGIVERNAGFLFLVGFLLLLAVGALTPLGILQIVYAG